MLNEVFVKQINKRQSKICVMGIIQKEQINLEYFMFVLVFQEGALYLKS